jgi:hypothetical protein
VIEARGGEDAEGARRIARRAGHRAASARASEKWRSALGKQNQGVAQGMERRESKL